MTVPTQPLPTLGSANSTEDPKIRSVLSELQTILTAGVDATNLASAAVTSAKLAPTITSVTSMTGTDIHTLATVVTATFTPAVAGRSLFIGILHGSLAAANPSGVRLRLTIDGVDDAYQPITAGSNGTNPFTVIGVWIKTLSNASHTSDLRADHLAGASSQATAAQLIRLELGS